MCFGLLLTGESATFALATSPFSQGAHIHEGRRFTISWGLLRDSGHLSLTRAVFLLRSNDSMGLLCSIRGCHPDKASPSFFPFHVMRYLYMSPPVHGFSNTGATLCSSLVKFQLHFFTKRERAPSNDAVRDGVNHGILRHYACNPSLPLGIV